MSKNEKRDKAADIVTHHARRLSPNEKDIWCDGYDQGQADLKAEAMESEDE